MNAQSSIPSFTLQNHRGAGEAAPENTLEAFEYSWQRGMDAECDVRTTRDGEIVPFHDKDFSRVVRNAGAELAKKGVRDLTWEELAALDVGGQRFADKHVSKLSEVFERLRQYPGRSLYLDYKDVDLKRLARLVEKHEVQNQTIFTTCEYDLIRQWNTLAARGRAMLWMRGEEEDLSGRIAELRTQGFAGLTHLNIHIFLRPGVEPDRLPPENPFALSDRFLIHLMDELDGHGILFQAIPWRISAPGVYRRLLEMGVKSIATDFPEAAQQAAQHYFQERQ